MAESWKKVVDSLYSLGGYGEWAEGDANPYPQADLHEETGLGVDDISEAVDYLRKSELANKSATGWEHEGASGMRDTVTLTAEGFALAHDRAVAKRNRKSNQGVLYLTFVLAVVGLSQAYALSTQAQAVAGKSGPLFATLAGVILLLIGVGIIARANAFNV